MLDFARFATCNFYKLMGKKRIKRRAVCLLKKRLLKKSYW
ncbi:hypothetical protein NEOC65_000392 [Neochlamydia sp. AcF65]|nr:hypothetical protein [Neochlamydia sp. AcF65]